MLRTQDPIGYNSQLSVMKTLVETPEGTCQFWILPRETLDIIHANDGPLGVPGEHAEVQRHRLRILENHLKKSSEERHRHRVLEAVYAMSLQEVARIHDPTLSASQALQHTCHVSMAEEVSRDVKTQTTAVRRVAKINRKANGNGLGQGLSA